MTQLPASRDRHQIGGLFSVVYDALKLPAKALLAAMPDGIKKHLFGSDAFNRYTSSYTWIANQFGHFAAGAVFYTLLAGVIAAATEARAPGSYWWAVGALAAVVVLYGVKEVADAYLEYEKRSPQFKVDLKEMAADGATDTFFVVLGAVFAHAGLWWLIDGIIGFGGHPGSADWVVGVLLAGGVGIAVWRGCVYLPRMKAFDNAALPSYFRLTRFDGTLSPDNAVSTVKGFVDHYGRNENGTTAETLVLVAPPSYGKTLLACGVACGFTARGLAVRYSFASSLISGSHADYSDICAVADADLLMVDDVTDRTLNSVLKEIKRTRAPGGLDRPLLLTAAKPLNLKAIGQGLPNGPVHVVSLEEAVSWQQPGTSSSLRTGQSSKAS